jgi:hypothetical protein
MIKYLIICLYRQIIFLDASWISSCGMIEFKYLTKVKIIHETHRWGKAPIILSWPDASLPVRVAALVVVMTVSISCLIAD